VTQTKKCKYCKSEIDKQAKVCPICRKNLWLWFFGSFFAIIFCIFIIWTAISTISDTNNNYSNNNINIQKTEVQSVSTPCANEMLEVAKSYFNLETSIEILNCNNYENNKKFSGSVKQTLNWYTSIVQFECDSEATIFSEEQFFKELENWEYEDWKRENLKTCNISF
jgi:hypothetical protein